MKLTADPQLDDLPYEQRRAFILTVECPSCFGGKIGMPCMAMNGNRSPVTTGPHAGRIKVAHNAYRFQQAKLASAATN